MSAMIYYISDLHLGHANIIKLCKRPFSDVDEMNAVLFQTGMTVSQTATRFTFVEI